MPHPTSCLSRPPTPPGLLLSTALLSPPPKSRSSSSPPSTPVAPQVPQWHLPSSCAAPSVIPWTARPEPPAATPSEHPSPVPQASRCPTTHTAWLTATLTQKALLFVARFPLEPGHRMHPVPSSLPLASRHSSHALPELPRTELLERTCFLITRPRVISLYSSSNRKPQEQLKPRRFISIMQRQVLF